MSWLVFLFCFHWLLSKGTILTRRRVCLLYPPSVCLSALWAISIWHFFALSQNILWERVTEIPEKILGMQRWEESVSLKCRWVAHTVIVPRTNEILCFCCLTYGFLSAKQQKKHGWICRGVWWGKRQGCVVYGSIFFPYPKKWTKKIKASTELRLEPEKQVWEEVQPLMSSWFLILLWSNFSLNISYEICSPLFYVAGKVKAEYFRGFSEL